VRIIAGTLGGRTIRAPRGDRTRPTADKVRQAVFNIIYSVAGSSETSGAGAVLDLYAGSGALGLEALSRGALRAVFVDHGAEAVRCIAANARDLELEDKIEIMRADVLQALSRLAGPFDLVFLDPPYAARAAEPALAALPPLLAPEALVVVEHDRRSAPGEQIGPLSLRDRRRYGDTEVSFYK
jgi:16S rRNA (guanine(966)-N(2))-methyltransferase RsmD